MKCTVGLARFPGNFHEDPDCVDWIIKTILEMRADPRIEHVKTFTKADTPITMVRNECIEWAKREQVDYLLMIDNDMRPDQPRKGAVPFWKTAFDWMFQRKTPALLAAPYCGPYPHNNVYVFQWVNFNNTNPLQYRLDQFTRSEAAVRTGIEKVAALPTGLMLIDMRIFNYLRPPYFEYEWADPPYNTKKASTEDVFFSRNVATALYQAGFNDGGCYVLWDSWAEHIKRTHVPAPEVPHPDHYAKMLLEADELGVPSDKKIIMVQNDDFPIVA